MEFYLSDLLSNPVFNQSKEKIGNVQDLVLSDISKSHPKITGLVLKRDGKKEAVFIPEHDLTTISPKLINLSTDLVDLTPFIQKNDEVLLSKDVYDKQVVDIDDRRLTRVNDLLLESVHNILRVEGVDVSAAGILRRLNIPNLGNWLKRNIVDWEDVQFLGGQLPVKFKIHYHNLESLHPVDIARIIFEGPGYKQGSKVISSLKDPIAADIIEELSPKLQKNLIETMKIEDVADVIEHMPAHKAADLLVVLGSDYTNRVIPAIKKAHAEKIQSLLNYPENSCGAFMTTDFVAIPYGITFDQALSRIKDIDELPDFALYIYVLENEFSNKLVGVLSNHEFFLSDRRSRTESLMVKNPIVVRPNDNIKDALKKMYQYNLSALPVVARTDGKMLGIVTFRDAISIYLPKRWKVRIRQVFSNGN